MFSGYYNKFISSSNRATVLSMISMFSGFYVALMGLLIGYLGDISIRIAFAFMGVLIIVSAVLLIDKTFDTKD